MGLLLPRDYSHLDRSNIFKEHKLDREAGSFKATGYEFLCIKLIGKRKYHDVDGGGPLHPRKDNALISLIRKMDDEGFLIAVPLISRSILHGNSKIFTQLKIELGKKFSFLVVKGNDKKKDIKYFNE